MPVAGSSILARFIKLIAYAEQKAGSLGSNTDVNMAVNVFGNASEIYHYYEYMSPRQTYDKTHRKYVAFGLAKQTILRNCRDFPTNCLFVQTWI